eukprot:CAMPEP_0176500532 /NCGR_PEP_ID=MMETSP0200_2-20121128/13608_1 /TAXON_ID=947934 /ORGANISM="Chaetoceros sp., Strain GSL56" /LENGTH=81 /DNA_ID=CAMNT_0017899219 /DNA_START=345 /DNA_END=587 /DNA_ORIENTATION=-
MTKSPDQSTPPDNKIIANSATGGSPSGNSKARILGSAIAGISELALFHPVDTVAKRLMSTETRIVATSVSGTALNLNHAIF